MKNFARTIFVAAALAALGGCASEEAAPVSAAANACPAWPEYPDSNSNQASPYLGCTNALNLYHMVEDKGDLKQGRDLGPADGEREARAVDNYEQDKVKKSTGSSSSQTIFAPLMTGAPAGGQ